ncbi:MAG: hypothetical protein WD398_05560 [Cyclobacteriaceae bacterium]
MTKESKKHIISGKPMDRNFDFNIAHFAFHELFNLNPNDDRSIAIIGGTFLEMSLEHILRAYFPENDKEVNKMFEGFGPLSSFSAKISMSYSLGLIEKPVKEDLLLTKKIRNEFAHNLYASFENDKIGQLCKLLKWHKIAFVPNPPPEALNIELFQVGVNQLITHLSGCISMARGEKRSIRDNFK